MLKFLDIQSALGIYIYYLPRGFYPVASYDSITNTFVKSAHINTELFPMDLTALSLISSSVDSAIAVGSIELLKLIPFLPLTFQNKQTYFEGVAEHFNLTSEDSLDHIKILVTNGK